MNRLRFKTSRKLLVILEEFRVDTSINKKRNQKMSTFNMLELETLGPQRIVPKNSPYIGVELEATNNYIKYACIICNWQCTPPNASPHIKAQ